MYCSITNRRRIVSAPNSSITWFRSRLAASDFIQLFGVWRWLITRIQPKKRDQLSDQKRECSESDRENEINLPLQLATAIESVWPVADHEITIVVVVGHLLQESYPAH